MAVPTIGIHIRANGHLFNKRAGNSWARYDFSVLRQKCAHTRITHTRRRALCSSPHACASAHACFHTAHRRPPNSLSASAPPHRPAKLFRSKLSTRLLRPTAQNAVLLVSYALSVTLTSPSCSLCLFAFAHSDIGLGGGCQRHGTKDASLSGKVSHDSADFGEFWAAALEVERLLVPQLRAGQHSPDVGRAVPKMHKPSASIANTTLRSLADLARSSDNGLSSSSNSVMEERESEGVRES